MKSEKGQAVVSAGAIAFVILLVLAVAMYYGATNFNEAVSATETVLRSLPLSDHALQKTLTDVWSVASVTAWMESGKCNPIIVYSCAGGITKYICPLDPNKTGPKSLYFGIIIGDQTFDGSEVVITGFIAPLKTWDRLGVRDGCVSNTMPTGWLMP